MAVGDGREPIFKFHSNEDFHPLAVESVERIGKGVKLPGGGSEDAIELASLPPEGGRMVLPSGAESKAEEAKLQSDEELKQVAYRRIAEGGGMQWVQYWLWYLYNPKRFYVAGEHEGDWEFVQVGYAADVPVCMTASQHKSGGARWWWEIELEGERPVVYVARGSHANYFEPRLAQTEFDDEADGQGLTLDALRWHELAEPWRSWPGRWGNSTGPGESPESPGCQGTRWKAPHLYHASAEHQG